MRPSPEKLHHILARTPRQRLADLAVTIHLIVFADLSYLHSELQERLCSCLHVVVEFVNPEVSDKSDAQTVVVEVLGVSPHFVPTSPYVNVAVASYHKVVADVRVLVVLVHVQFLEAQHYLPTSRELVARTFAG